MSLINQVLQDLQERRAPDFDCAAATLRDVAVPIPKPTVRRALPPALLWVMIALLAGISAALLWHQRSTRGLAEKPMPPRALPVAKSVPVAAAALTAPTTAVSSPANTAPLPVAPVARPVATATAASHAAPATPAAAVASIGAVATAKNAPEKSASTLSAAAPQDAPVKPALTSPATASISSLAAATSPATAPVASTLAPTTVTPSTPAETPTAPRSASPAVLSPAASPVEKTLRPMSAEQRAELAYRDGMRLLQSGRPSIATPRLQAALNALPAYYPARAALAALLINNSRLAEAHTLLSAGLELAPQQALLAKLDGRVLIEQGQLPQARAVLERAAPPVSSDPEYYSLLGALYQRMGLYAQAAQSYRSIVETDPRNGVWWLGLGMALEASGDNSAARGAYERAQQTGSLNRDVLQFVQAKLAALP